MFVKLKNNLYIGSVNIFSYFDTLLHVYVKWRHGTVWFKSNVVTALSIFFKIRPSIWLIGMIYKKMINIAATLRKHISTDYKRPNILKHNIYPLNIFQRWTWILLSYTEPTTTHWECICLPGNYIVFMMYFNIDGLLQDCNIFSALAMVLQSCTKSSYVKYNGPYLL